MASNFLQKSNKIIQILTSSIEETRRHIKVIDMNHK